MHRLLGKYLLPLVCGLTVAVFTACLDDSEVVESEQELAIGGDVDGVPGCPGSWDYLESFDGFVGTYGRLGIAPDGELVNVTITDVNERLETIFVNGSYVRAVKDGWTYRAESGQYVALPINPLIGSGILFNDETGDEPRDGYVIVGERRSAWTGNIAQLCLAKLSENPDSHVDTAFVLYRWM